jgi:hypothetical protein
MEERDSERWLGGHADDPDEARVVVDEGEHVEAAEPGVTPARLTGCSADTNAIPTETKTLRPPPFY